MNDKEAKVRKAKIQELREFADWLDATPDARLPYPLINHNVSTKEEFLRVRRVIGGTWTKSVEEGSSYFSLARKVPYYQYDLYILREKVCERVVTKRTEEVEEYDHKELANLKKVKRTVEREDVDWVCPESIIRDQPTKEEAASE